MLRRLHLHFRRLSRANYIIEQILIFRQNMFCIHNVMTINTFILTGSFYALTVNMCFWTVFRQGMPCLYLVLTTNTCVLTANT